MNKKAYGFTIVELLIVIVVIGILAAISIVAYNNVNNKAHDSTVKNDLANAAKQIELFKVEPGRYPRDRVSEFTPNFKFSKNAYSRAVNNAMYCVNQNTDQYALGVTSKSGMRYLLTQNGIEENVAVDANAVCGAIGTSWTAPSTPTTAIHGFSPTGTAPNYINGWHSTWVWTN